MIICTRRKTSERFCLFLSSSIFKSRLVKSIMKVNVGFLFWLQNVQNFRSKVHPVLCTPARDDSEVDDRRSCTNLKDPPALNGGFLVSSSISEANWKREKWIKTDAECKSRSILYTQHLNTNLFYFRLSRVFHNVCFFFCRSCSGTLKINTHCNKPTLMFSYETYM